jgi:alanyl-tRNA synthetase
MKWRTGKEIRREFIDFWVSRGSRHYPSFSLIPDDPTLLFTIAGMVPFKPYYLGIMKPEVTRAVTSQKCVRTNDIDNVGRTARHHTFFEMLGNFSWGDYFKYEAITWAWEFLTDVIGLDGSRLYATIYKDDEEAYSVWRNTVGLPDERIYRFDKDENFWFMGNQGPCGPCSEILYDQGPSFSCGRPECRVGCNCDRYLEIWNLVFTQFDLQKDGTLLPLPKNNIDTGMGLERLTSIVQGVRTDFETDLFRPIIDHVCSSAGIVYGASQKSDLAARVISDHLRSVAFMIADGILPANDGQGYVLRRLLRRAARYGKLIGFDRPFLLDFLPDVISIMEDPYVELCDNRMTIEQIIDVEEKRFLRTLQQGTELLDAEIAALHGQGRNEIPGDVAFELYDTYGFPFELTLEIAQEQSMTVDKPGFDCAMEEQRARARASSKHVKSEFTGDVYSEILNAEGNTEFLGYDRSEIASPVLAIVNKGERLDSLEKGMKGEIVLKKTVFYAEKGGQIGDTGFLNGPNSVLEVVDTIVQHGSLTVHKVKVLDGVLRTGETVNGSVNVDRRDAIRKNHTATHLLHEALGRVLGGHVRQAGSLVSEKSLRFDFTHFDAMTQKQIEEVETIVNERIQANTSLEVTESDMEHARSMGAKALFEEKYGDVVRVVQIPGFSMELCGGLHVDATGDIGIFKILREESVGSGTRRITAVTGMEAFSAFQRLSRVNARVSGLLSASEEGIDAAVEALIEHSKELERRLEEAKLKAATSSIESKATSVSVGPVTLWVGRFDDTDADLLRELGDSVKQKTERSVVLFASAHGEDVLIVAMADQSAVDSGANAGTLVKKLASMVGGKGGGRPNMAQAGGRDPSKIQALLDAAPFVLSEILGG